MYAFYKCFFTFLVLILMAVSFRPLYSIYTTPTGQRMIEQSNRMYSGNKYNLTQDQIRQARQGFYNPGYYQGYPAYYQNYYYGTSPNYYFNPPVYSPYLYGYGYYDATAAYYDAFPDKTRADALYSYLQSR